MLVFLIHDNEAERLNRRENRRTRADDDAGAALPDFVPFIMAFAGGQMAVQNGNERLQFTGTESSFKSFNRLWRQRNLRHEHNRTLALPQRIREGLKINFRLAATSNAMQKKSAWVRVEQASRLFRFGVAPNLCRGCG